MSNPLPEKITSLLEKGPLLTRTLVEILCREENVTPQGVYKALRLLRKQEVLSIHQKMVSLSLIWIDQELERLVDMSRVYQSPGRATAYLSLEPGEQARFRFRTLKELDLFWTHSFLIIQSRIGGSVPIYSIIPHDWFYYARPETDHAWTNTAMKVRRPQNIVITCATELDKLVYKKRKDESIEVYFHSSPFSQNDRTYFNIVDDWFFEGKLDSNIASKLNLWIAKQNSLPEKNDSFLPGLIDMPGKFELTISHSPIKTIRMKKKIARYFTR